MTKRQFIQRYILSLGIQPQLKGFRYLEEAIAIYEPGMQITKVLYADVAKKFNTTKDRAERAIRHAKMNAGHEACNSAFIALCKLEVDALYERRELEAAKESVWKEDPRENFNEDKELYGYICGNCDCQSKIDPTKEKAYCWQCGFLNKVVLYGG